MSQVRDKSVGYAVRKGYKQTEVGSIPDQWEVKRLSEISPKQSVGLVINPSTYFTQSGTVPMLVGSNVSENFIDVAKAKRISAASNESLPASRINAGDLVMVRVGEPGVTAVVPLELDGCNCASMMIVRKSDSFNSQWLCHLMNSSKGRQEVLDVQYGTAQKQFNISDAISFLYAVPPRPEQDAIAEAISDVDATLDVLSRLIAKKRDLKQAAMQQLLTGQTRLHGFDGEWTSWRLGDKSTCFSGGTPPTSIAEYYQGDIPWITSGDLNEGHIHSVRGRISRSGLRNSACKMVEPGTLLMALYGATAGVTGMAMIDAAINQAVLAIVPSNVDSAFLYHKLQSLKEWLISTYTQGGQPNLSGEIVKSVELEIPTVEEQTAIATVLSDMDAEIEKLEARFDKTRLLKQGMMQELLTGRTRLV